MASLIAQGGHYDWQIVNGANTYGKENIVSGTLTDGIYQECGIGNCIARQLDLRLWNVTLDTSSPIVLTCTEVSSSGTTTNHAKGTYYIDTVSTSPYSEYTEVTAFDAMLKTEAVYMKEGEWSATTASAIISEIKTAIGITLADLPTSAYFTQNDKTIDQAPSIGENGTTMRQMLSMIGCLYGGNWIISDTNLLVFVPLFGELKMQSLNPVINFTLNPYTVGDEVVNFDKSDLESIVGIEFQQNGGQIFRAPSGLTDDEWEALEGLIIKCNLPCMASQEAVDAVWSVYGSLLPSIPQYIPYTANTVYIDPWAKAGSLATIKNTNVYVSNRTINIDSLGACDLSANATTTINSHYPYISPQVREARQKAEENYAAITILPSQIMSEVYTKGETDQRISSSVTQTATELTISFDEKLGTAVGEANAYTQEQTEGLRTYFTFGSDGLTIGKSGSPFKTEISNTELAFTGESGEKAAWINANQLNIQEAVIPATGDIQLKGSSGKWVQQVRNDHFQIRWVGN